MEHQNQILQTLRAPESQARLERIVAQEALNNRAAVGRRVCAEFGFVDARGSAQLAGCLKALNTLHKAGRIALPASRRVGGAPTPQRFDAPVAAATAVPGTVEAVAGLSLERVEQGRQRRVWNTLLHFEHPQGTTTFAGCQVRYLVVSAHGVLGAVGFSASALHLRAREAWMGWSDEQRQAHLHRVLCLSRFLIRPGVQCRNLASQVLGQVLARLPADFEARYRYRPWLVETFVGPAHDGASFKAANFVWVGHTAGRGRQDRDHARARPVKSVYMYELEPHWRRRLGVARVARRRRWRRLRVSTAPPGRGTSLEGRRWAISGCRRVWSRARGCWRRCPARRSPPTRPTTARRSRATTGSSTSRCRRRSRPGTFSRPTGRARCSGCAARTRCCGAPG